MGEGEKPLVVAMFQEEEERQRERDAAEYAIWQRRVAPQMQADPFKSHVAVTPTTYRKLLDYAERVGWQGRLGLLIDTLVEGALKRSEHPLK